MGRRRPPVKIGLDARYFTHPQEGGFRSYTLNLVAAIARVDTQNDYVLYTDRPLEGDLPGENFSVRVAQGSLPVREQVAMPIALARDRVDVAHFMCNTAPLLIRCPFVLTIHDVIPRLPEPAPHPKHSRRERLLDKYWREVIPIAAARAAHIVTVSESSAQDILRALGTRPERISVLRNGIDPAFRVMDSASRASLPAEYDLPPGPFFLGFLSKEPRKNTAGVLQAFQSLRRRVVDCHLALVGGSREDMAAITESAVKDTRIHILQRIPRENLVALYGAATGLVFPSYAEGFGLPVVEAMACGTPVITSKSGSLPEIAGDAAIFVDAGDTNGIARAMLELLSNDRLRQALRAKGLERAAAFSWDETARRMIEVYHRAAKSSPAEVRA